MSEQWHYEQKGESYIKVDTLHKIRTLESELAAVTEQRDRLAEALRNLGNRILSVHPNRDISKELNEAAEVLQSLTQPAAKGGSHES